MNKSKKSMLNAITALLNMLITSIVGLVLGKTILNFYGSEYNGINSTVTQIIGTIMVLEGGFTLASNIALFKPFANRDIETINGILAATKKRFFVVGVSAFAIGLIVSLIYPFLVSSAMPYWEFVLLMLTVLLPSCFNLGFNTKHRVILLAEQKEYIISIFSTITYTLGNITAIVAMNLGASLIAARAVIAISLLTNYSIIALYCKKKYPFINFNVTPMNDKIKGTKSVIALKLTSVAYTTLPIVAISMIPNEGAMLASVYAVYKSVISMIKGSLSSITNAPRLGFGALIAESRNNDAKKLFRQYELITCVGLGVILSTTCLLIMPFIDIYTKGIQDINYHNNVLAIIMLSTVFLEVLHIPSGQIIQMSGNFEVSRKMQTVACIALLTTLVLGGYFGGIYGIATSTLVSAAILSVMEIGYVRKTIFHAEILSFIRNMLPSLIICVGCAIIGFNGVLKIHSYLEFIGAGITCVCTTAIVTAILNLMINGKQFISVLKLLKKIIFKNQKTYVKNEE